MHSYDRKLSAGLPNGEDPNEFFAAFFRRIGVDFDALSLADKKRWLEKDSRALAAAQQDLPSLEAFLPAMKLPCLLYAGEADGLFDQCEKSARSITDSKFVAFAGLDHGSAFDSSKIVLPDVLAFLQQVQHAASC